MSGSGLAGCATIVLVLLMAGCVEVPACRPVGRVSADRPADWRTGPELSMYYLITYHSGEVHRYVFQNDSTPLPAPASCVAFRGPHAYARDTCSIDATDDGDGAWKPGAAWVAHAYWDGDVCGAERVGPGTISLFDESGRTVAWWQNLTDPALRHLTE